MREDLEYSETEYWHLLIVPLPDLVNLHTESSAYTQHWVLHTWDELIMGISQVGRPLHEFEEDLGRGYLI